MAGVTWSRTGVCTRTSSSRWNGRAQDDREVLGEIVLRSALLFGSGSELTEMFLSQQHHLIDSRSSRVFYYYPYQGGPIYAFLAVNGQILEDRIFIFNVREVFRAVLTYTEYLRALRLTRGVAILRKAD